MADKVDVLILGGGIAGTTLAWSLHESKRSFLLIDDERPETASRIAAGLVTPITGKRLNETYQWSSAFQRSDIFYRNVEERLNETVWYRSGSVRLLDHTQNDDQIRDRLQQFKHIDTTWLDSDWFDADLIKDARGFFMSQASRLDAKKYLNASHRYFEQLGMYTKAWIDLDEDLFCYPTNVFYRPSQMSAHFAICCRGIADQSHPLFQRARFNPVQGDILRIETHRPLDTTTLNCGWWLTPTMSKQTVGCFDLSKRPKCCDWLLGATYQWRPLDGLPSPSARDSLLEKFRQRIRVDCNVSEHHAAVRPATYDQKPLLGLHDQKERIGILNGLGAKGCYLSPWCAGLLVRNLFDQQPIPKELMWNR